MREKIQSENEKALRFKEDRVQAHQERLEMSKQLQI